MHFRADESSAERICREADASLFHASYMPAWLSEALLADQATEPLHGYRYLIACKGR